MQNISPFKPGNKKPENENEIDPKTLAHLLSLKLLRYKNKNIPARIGARKIKMLQAV